MLNKKGTGKIRLKSTYIMIDTQTHKYKIGVSTVPEFRERTLKSEKPDIKLLYVCKDRNIEGILHKQYAHKRIRGEWFNLDVSEINHIVKEHNFEKVV